MFKQFNAYIVGYYGMHNTGDDALLYSARWASHHLLGSENNLISSATDSQCQEFGDIQAIPKGRFRGKVKKSSLVAALFYIQNQIFNLSVILLLWLAGSKVVASGLA